MPESCCLQMLAAETNAQQQVTMRLQRSTAVACNDQLKELVSAVGHARLQVVLPIRKHLDLIVKLLACSQGHWLYSKCPRLSDAGSFILKACMRTGETGLDCFSWGLEVGQVEGQNFRAG